MVKLWSILLMVSLVAFSLPFSSQDTTEDIKEHAHEAVVEAAEGTQTWSDWAYDKAQSFGSAATKQANDLSDSGKTFAQQAGDHVKDTISGYVKVHSAGNQGAVTTNRRLLQVLTPCTVPFQVQNYTIITSECKGPQYSVNACCPAFVKFACPFAAQINDNTTDCAATMFNYINNFGRYPPGLFANECQGDANGLPCPNVTTAVETSRAEHNLHHNRWQFWWLITVINFVLWLHLHCSG